MKLVYPTTKWLRHLHLLVITSLLLSFGAVPVVRGEGGTGIYLPLVLAPPQLPVYAWHTFYGSMNADFGQDIVIDGAGNLYVVGFGYENWLGPDSQPPLSSYPMPKSAASSVVLSLDAEGNYRWHTFVGFGQGRGIALGPGGSIYIVASYAPNWRGPNNQAPLHEHSGDRDLCIAKLDATGHYLWHTFYGSSGLDEAYAIAVDSAGNAVIGGYSADEWLGPNGEFPLEPFHDKLSAPNGSDGILLKLNSEGAYRWHGFYGAPSSGSSESINDVVIDDEDGIYVTGRTAGSWLTVSGTAPLHDGLLDDVFAMKLTPSGQHIWHTFWGNPAPQAGMDIALDGAKDIFIALTSVGSWSGQNDTPPIHPANSEYLQGVLSLSTTGQYRWHTFYDSAQSQPSPAIAVAADGLSYITWHAGRPFSADNAQPPLHPYPNSERALAILALAPTGSYRWHTFYGADNSESNFFNTPHPAYHNSKLYVVGTDRNWYADGILPKHAFSGTIDMQLLSLKAAK